MGFFDFRGVTLKAYEWLEIVDVGTLIGIDYKITTSPGWDQSKSSVNHYHH
tara:strand:- start:760 stop:912 length:153 start_codon:yes stop_codon:yes gene_type:complete